MKRTDLAMEAHELWRQSAADTTKLPGVRARTDRADGLQTTVVEILDEKGAKALGKPVGVYTTLELPQGLRAQRDYARQAEEQLCGRLQQLLQEMEGSVLVVGLGNRAVTPDAIGPLTASRLLVTRHLTQQLPDYFGSLRPVCALTPGVLAQTGLESAEIVRSVVRRLRPACMVAVDALAASELGRICTTVQISDAGIVPGSGIGNHRAAFNRETMGVPVIAVGVPTVVDAACLTAEGAPAPPRGMVVSTTDIDERVDLLSGLVAMALNRALQPGLTRDEITEFVP